MNALAKPMSLHLFFFIILINNSYAQCDPGIMSPGPLYICDGEYGAAPAAFVQLDETCKLGYILLDNSAGVITDFLGYNATGVFERGTANYDEFYYIYSVIGPDNDGNGLPDLDNPNLIISNHIDGDNYTEVLFLTDIEITAVQQCDQATGQSIITLSATGGLLLSLANWIINGDTLDELPSILYDADDLFSFTYFFTSPQLIPPCTATLEFDPEPCLFDLALTKVLADGQPSVVMPGDDVTFTIEVFNQGSFAVQGIDIVDYIPSGFVLNDPDWTADGNTATTDIAGSLSTGSSTTVDITLTVEPGTDAGSYENFAEIVNFENLAGNPADDLDSTPDNDPNNDGPVSDNVVDGSMDDEDDHDVATIAVNLPTFDLALIKTLADGQSSTIAPAENVTFTITVYNQGQAIAQNIVITDYIPAGLSLNDPAWSLLGAKASATIAGPIVPNSSASINITFSVLNNIVSSTETNFAEITSADDMFGNPGIDLDSTPDSNNENDGTPIDNEINNPILDEDDHDLATITILGNLSDVWPGDLNFDGICNNEDRSISYYHIGANGPARSAGGLAWEAKAGYDWGIAQDNGHDIKHHDCNGNGSINSQDANAITINYGKTHPLPPGIGTPKPPVYSNTDFQILLQPINQISPNSNTIIMNVVLDSRSGQNLEVFGGHFSIDYYNIVSNVDTAFMAFSNFSWLGIPNVDLLAESWHNETAHTIEVGFTKTNGMASTGKGVIGQAIFALNTTNLNRNNNCETLLDVAIIKIGAFNAQQDSLPIEEANRRINLNATCCEPNIVIDKNTPFQNLYRSSGTISTTGYLPVGENQQVEYHGNHIRLNSGFRVKARANFRAAYSNNCSASLNCDPLFNDYTDLATYVNPNNCANKAVEEYYDGSFYNYLYIREDDQGALYLFNNGLLTYYGNDTGDASLPAAYGMATGRVWHCGC